MLVTGAAKRYRARDRADVCAGRGERCDYLQRTSQNDAEETVRDLAALDVEAMAVRCEIRDPADVKQTVGAVVEEFGRLDLLVNNAGTFESVDLGRHLG